MNMNNFYKQIVKGVIRNFSNGNYKKFVKRGQKVDLRLNKDLVLELDEIEGDIFILQTEKYKYIRPIMNIHVGQESLSVITLSNSEEYPGLKYLQNTVYKICSGHE